MRMSSKHTAFLRCTYVMCVLEGHRGRAMGMHSEFNGLEVNAQELTGFFLRRSGAEFRGKGANIQLVCLSTPGVLHTIHHHFIGTSDVS
jgi:hypothetical protein